MIEDFYAEITKRYGEIKRARGFYLYTEKDVRLLDMYLDGGHSVLGWRFGKSRLYFKNSLDRGFSGSYARDFKAKLNKALKLYCKEYSDFRFLADFNKIAQVENFCKENFGQKNIPILRPWQNIQKTFDCVEVLIPFGWNGFKLFAFKGKALDFLREKKINSCAMPFPLQEAICRAFYDLISELPNRSEKDFSAFDDIFAPYFKRDGSYLFSTKSEVEYNDVFFKFLDAGILISPDFNLPSVVPFNVEKSTFKKLK